MLCRTFRSRCFGLLLAIAALAAACAEPVAPPQATPVDGTAVAVRADAGALDTFVAAQGTWCDPSPDGWLWCGYLPPDVGWIFAIGRSPEYDPTISYDFGGVNRRWWDRNRPADALARPFTYTGTVSESRMGDGRRRVRVTMKFDGALAAVISWSGLGTLVGADFYDYGTLAPTLGNGQVHADFAVPADYVGMPDVGELVYSGRPGFELLDLKGRIEVVGPLNVDYDGMAAGTMVKAVATSVWLSKLASGPRPGPQQIVRNFDIGSNFSISRVR